MAYTSHGDLGASQFAGAGFIQSQANTFDNAYGSGGATRKAQNTEQTLRSVTIKQLLKDNLNAHDGAYTVDGIDITTVTLLGRVTEFNDRSIHIQLVVDDGTASVDVISFNDDSATQQNPQTKRDWQVGKYVRVVGNLRHFQQKISVQAYSIRPVFNHNEVTYHYLQCIFQHLHLTKGSAAAATAGAGGGVVPPTQGYGAPKPAGAPAPAYGGAAPASGGPRQLHDVLMEFYSTPENAARDSGIHLDEAERALRARGVQLTRQSLKTAAEFLCNEGHMYTTLDENTFRCISG